MTHKTYAKILEVLGRACRPLAAHEFQSVDMRHPNYDGPLLLNGRQYVGCSESALARRLREMRALGMVVAARRPGAAFVEYAKATARVAA